ncbi:YihY/virulence factor BrkB family protein [Salinarimonas sp.]|uniref:YihY/virulence factor BrkB family protein n=1 Tax=Salinarimonas sp. TaxID=2766526 RepID=UPI00391B4C3D
MDRARKTVRETPSIARTVVRETLTDRMMLVAAGLAFFATFAIMPAFAAIGLVIGIFVPPDALRRELQALGEIVPEDTLDLMIEFLTEVPAGLGLGVTLIVNLAIVFWTIQRSASGLVTTLNMVYDCEETRGRMRREGVAILLAVGGLLFVFLALVMIAAVPVVLPLVEGWSATALRWGRWPLLGLLFLGGIALVYRYVPNHAGKREEEGGQAAAEKERSWRVLGIGPFVATAIFLVASILLALYLQYGQGWDHFYGTATSVVVLMTWIFVMVLALMIGAETNAQIVERMRGGDGDTLRRFERHQRAS